ncbi:MAG: sodium-dependent transporter [Abditibacteriota bacterium]|nr:sodium-dependent transporter [Abditibacteriota bacterium]
MSRERLGSRIGFLMLSAGSAIGCGNVWKFPWLTGENGGGLFVLIYLALAALIGLPAMCMEISLGRAAQASPVKMYDALQKPGQKWNIHGYACLAANICVSAFYSVVCGWIIYYFICFALGRYAGLSFKGMIADPLVNVLYMAAAVAVTFFILSFNLKSGLERVSKFLMLALFALMVFLAVRCSMFRGAVEGLKFYLVPDFSKLTWSVVPAAANQAFFSLSVGFGIVALFGSYIDRGRSILGEAWTIVLLDSLAAILAGLIIFPTCFAHGVDVGAGPGLLFDTMADAFRNMQGGRILGSLFFLFMVFAALTSLLSICETILGCVRELTGWGRKKGSAVCGAGVALLSLTTALGYSLWQFRPFGEGSSWLDLWDFSVTNVLFPLGALVIALFCTNMRFGWGWDNFVREANAGEGMKVKGWMKPVFCFVTPASILLLFIIGMATFKWH